MKNNKLIYASLFSLLFLLSSCEIIGDIFQTGVGVGVILVVLIIAIGGYLFSKMRGRR